MSAKKIIFKKYFYDRRNSDTSPLFASWMLVRRDDPEREGLLEEMWNGIDIEADSGTRRDLNTVKRRLGVASETAAVRFRLAAFIAAACLCLFVALGLSLRVLSAGPDREDVFARLSMLNVDSVSQTTIISDNGVKTVGDDVVIADSLYGKAAGMVQVVVPRGRRSCVQLCDGTSVWINSGTKLCFYTGSGIRRREVWVDGELYLDVARDESKPFVVNTPDAAVRVLGTQFNVRSYSSEPESVVVLVEGVVEFSAAASKEILRPGQAVFYGDSILYKRDVNVNDHICWKNGSLDIDGESLDGILKKLSRHYRVSIVNCSGRNDKRYSGKLLLGASVDDVIDIIAVKEDLSVSKDGSTICLIDK